MLDARGEPRLDEIARLLGTTEDDARAQLGTLVFDDPGTGRLMPAAEYLSGKVREKLRQAEHAAEDDSRFTVNVTELRRVIPPDLTPGEIDARLGAAWIDVTYVQQFLREVLDDPRLRVEHPGGQIWAVRGDPHTVLARSTWGTSRYPAPQLAQALLEQRSIEVRDTITDAYGQDGSVLNADATLAAQEKATELAERFSDWAWEDPARAAALARTYNGRFNSLVLRSYDDAALSLPGLALTFRPRPHQVAAVARMICEPAVLLAHEVGAGKTAEMIMGVTELRRLGLVRKPVVVVPNHMLEQFAREWLQLYPQAKVMTAGQEDLQRDRRREFIARCATGTWDGIVMSRSAFERIPLSAREQQAYMDRELEQMREWIRAARSADGITVKKLEGALLRAEERLRAKLDSAKDPGITFEATGIDYLCIDEAHGYKNLRTPSNIGDAAIDGSMRASDLDMKIDYLRRRNGRRVVTFATATPIANSVTEAYVMQRYLRPDLLEAAGIEVFDTWAATFGQVVSQVELAPEGGSSFRMKSRFARFANVPEMLRMLHVAADVKTAEDLALPVPDLKQRADGQRVPETVTVEPHPPCRIGAQGLSGCKQCARRPYQPFQCAGAQPMPQLCDGLTRQRAGGCWRGGDGGLRVRPRRSSAVSSIEDSLLLRDLAQFRIQKTDSRCAPPTNSPGQLMWRRFCATVVCRFLTYYGPWFMGGVSFDTFGYVVNERVVLLQIAAGAGERGRGELGSLCWPVADSGERTADLGRGSSRLALPSLFFAGLPPDRQH